MCPSSTLTVLANFDMFRGLLLTVWGLKAISIVVEPQGMLTCWSSTLAVLVDSGLFHGLLLTVLGSRSVSIVVEPQGVLTCWSSTLAVLADSCQFLGLLLYFGVSESFPRSTNPGVRLRVGHQHSYIWPILVRFVHYYSAFLGPRWIFMIDEPRGAFMCLSSTLIV